MSSIFEKPIPESFSIEGLVSYSTGKEMFTKYFVFFRANVLFSCIVMISICMGSNVCASDLTKEFIVGMPENFPPHFFIDSQSNEPKGFGVDVMNAVAKKSGIKIEYEVFDNWKETIKATKNGHIDIIPNIGFCDERKSFVDFTLPYETFRIKFYIRTTSSFQNLANVKSGIIGVISTSKARYILEERGGYDLLFVNSAEDLVWKLISGDVDCIALPESVMNYILQKSRLVDHVKGLGEPLVEIKRGIAVSKYSPELLRPIRSALREFLLSQEYKNIYAKWHGNPKPFWNSKRIGIVSTLLVCTILLSTLFWRFRFITKVNKELEIAVKGRTKEIAESEKRYKQMFRENQAIKLVISPSDGRIVEANDAACVFYQYSMEKLLCMSIMEINTLSPEKIRKEMAAAKSQKRKHFNFTHKVASGELKNVEVYSSPINVGNDVLLFSIVHDISKRKRAEEALRKSEASLRQAQEIAKLGVWEVDIIADLICLKGENRKLFDISRIEDGCLTRDEFLKFVHKDDRALLQNIWAELATKGKASFEYRIVRSNGEIRWISGRGKTFLDKSGKPEKMFGVLQDITERKELENQLLQAQKMESIGVLAGGIAHDFNNILSSIIGFTELALQDAEKGSDQEDDLKEVQNASNRAKELVKQILAFARQTEDEMRPVRPSDVIEEVLKLLRPSTPSSIKVTTNIESNAQVFANPSQFHQIIMNLYSNSVYALQSCGDTIDISLRDIGMAAKQKQDLLGSARYVELCIMDNGPGIEEDIINKVFEPYYTTKGAGEGSGLGLAMVKGIVESWNGRISVESKPMVKTCFTILLPVSSIHTYVTEVVPEFYEQGSEHILFVDDEPSIAKMGGKILEKLGYQVSVYTSSLEALEFYKNHTQEIDLVISDMTMPQMTGEDFSIELRKIDREVPIIICTGYSKKMNAEKAKEIGINAFAYKPFTKIDFSKIIREVLDD